MSVDAVPAPETVPPRTVGAAELGIDRSDRDMARREPAVTFPEVSEQLPDLEITGPPARLRSSSVDGLTRLPARLAGAR
ncbi:hypothetical protein ABC795_13985 [Blastococcus sp. HT6-30]|uniref:hypothetical protein n=1 Tax=Blastococcus sp. HT6-30 TaxID=3144843 RepID=UPI003218EAE5